MKETSVIVYAHRGASGYTPENTMAAFREAVSRGADGIELDVQLTKDGELVICHDQTLDRTSNGHGRLADFTLAELKSLDFGSWFHPSFAGETIPSFTEFFTWYVTTPLLLNIEIKHGPVIYDGLEDTLVALLRRLCPDGFDWRRLIISSFHHPSLLTIKRLEPILQTGVLFDHYPVDVLSLVRETKADYLHPNWHHLDGDWLAAAHAAGIGVNAYTVNTEEEYAFVAGKIDGLFSNYPDRMKKMGLPQNVF